jgi:hypothetical protein
VSLSDPIDKVLHVAAGAFLVGSVALGGVWAIAIINAILWPLREAVQRGVKGKQPLRDWSADNHFEAWPPGVVGCIIAYFSS